MTSEPEQPIEEPLPQEMIHQAFVVAGRLLDYDEGIVLYHSWRVAILSEAIARRLGLEDPDASFVAGMLHDIGAVRLTDHIVHQATLENVTPGAVAHVVEGVRLLESIPVASDLAPLIAAHHEQVDGRGYPAGLKGADIPIEASVIHLADILDVVLRSLEPSQRAAKAHEILPALSGQAVFPEVSEAARDLLSEDPGLLQRIFEPTLLEREVMEPTRTLAGADRWGPVELATMLAWTLGRLTDAKHEPLAGHSLRVGYYATRIARRLPGLDVSFWEVLWAALLHDMGMASIPRGLIRRAGALSGPEVSLLREHSLVTRRLVEWIRPMAHLATAAAGHHEHYDGTGYPEGRSGEEIPLVSRILAYADTFDALTSNRPYRMAMPTERAFEELRRVAGTQLDPKLLEPAQEALRESGPLDGAIPTTLGDYMALCETGHFEVVLPSRTSHSSTRLRPVTHPVALLPSDPWVRVQIDREGHITKAPRTLDDILGFEPDSSLAQDWFDEQGAQWLDEALAQTPARETATSYLFTRRNRPVEVTLVAGAGETLLLLLRSASTRIDAAQNLTIFYRSFLQSTQPTVFLDRHLRIQEVNRSFLNLVGIALKDAIQHRPEDILFDRDQSIAWEGIENSIRNPNLGSWSGNLTIPTANGPRFVHLEAMAVRDSAGVDVGYLVTLQDRSNEVAQERRMRLLNEALLSMGPDYQANQRALVTTLARALGADQAFFCHRRDGAFRLDAASPSDEPDPATLDMSWCAPTLERAESDLIRVTPKLSEERVDNNKGAFPTRICHVIRDGNHRIGLLCIAFRRRRWLSSLESHFFGTLAGALVRQIQLEQVHRALQRREEQYRLLSENAGDVIWSMDSSGLIFYVNAAIREVIGVSPSDVVGKRAPDILTEDMMRQAGRQILGDEMAKQNLESPQGRKAFWHRIWTALTDLSTQEPVRLEMELDARDGSRKFLDIAARVVSSDPKNMFLHGIARDLTTRKQREQVLENRASQAEEMSRLKSELIASTSHDLKSPVNAIISYLNLVEDQMADLDTKSMQRYLGRMRDAADRLIRLISDVMDLEKLEAGVYSWRAEDVDLTALAQGLAALHESAAAQRHVDLQFHSQNPHILVQADEQALERVVSNLLSNAVKYSPADGTVTISVSSPVRGIARIVVEDQGPGIAPEDIERIFDRFYQGAAPQDPASAGPSSGLGLAIVRKLVELNMGRVWAEPAATGGARFVVELPKGDLMAKRPAALFVGHTARAGRLRGIVENAGLSLRIMPPGAPLNQIVSRTAPVLLFLDGKSDLTGPSDWSDLTQDDMVIVQLARELPSAPAGALLLTEPILDEEVVQIIRRALLQGANP